MLITDNTVALNALRREGSVRDALDRAGVDVNDYAAVCEYFGVDGR